MENNMLVTEPVSDPYKLLLVSEAGTDDIAVMSAAMRLHAKKDEILKAVDMLGVALADHGHQWTPEERAGYEAATRILRNPNAEKYGDDNLSNVRDDRQLPGHTAQPRNQTPTG